jgi:drug/metabolite transporter (DMT)-like permease
LPAPSAAWLAGVFGLALWFLASNLSLQYGAARLPAHTTAVVMITEVFFASSSAIAWGAGVLGLRTAVGGALIVSAALLAAWQSD